MTASDLLAEELLLTCSPATIRNHLLVDLLLDLHSTQIAIDILHSICTPLKPSSAATPPPFTLPSSSSSSSSSSSDSCILKPDPSRGAHGASIRSSFQSRIKKPSKLCVPHESRLASFAKADDFGLMEKQVDDPSPYRNVDARGPSSILFGVAAKKGRKGAMEDAYTVLLNLDEGKDGILGMNTQAFFAVFDGHGGGEAARFAAEKLGGNVGMEMERESTIEEAMAAGYERTDSEFLARDLKSGACAVSALLTNQQLVIGNAGDCKAVLCRDGNAEALTTLHRASNEEERCRIEELGGFVGCFNGVWRLDGTLAVTRAFGDKSLKTWVSIRPEVTKLEIDRNCEFLILASDGLWDMVKDQEAVDYVKEALLGSSALYNPIRAANGQQHRRVHAQDGDDSLVEACKGLIRIACSRGSLDDITVMIVALQQQSLVLCT